MPAAISKVSLTTKSGRQSIQPRCRFFLDCNIVPKLSHSVAGVSTQKKSFKISSNNLSGSPYAAMPIKMYSSSSGFRWHRCVIAEYHRPTESGKSIEYLRDSLSPLASQIVNVLYSPIASNTIIHASLYGLV